MTAAGGMNGSRELVRSRPVAGRTGAAGVPARRAPVSKLRAGSAEAGTFGARGMGCRKAVRTQVPGRVRASPGAVTNAILEALAAVPLDLEPVHRPQKSRCSGQRG